jgi:hypothetical protein
MREILGAGWATVGVFFGLWSVRRLNRFLNSCFPHLPPRGFDLWDDGPILLGWAIGWPLGLMVDLVDPIPRPPE